MSSNNAIVPIRANAATNYSGQQLDLIRRTVAADCVPDEFSLFIEVARRVGLDPFRKQIYAVVYSKDKPDKRKMAIIVGIDGYRSIAARGRDYRPDENPPVFTYDETLKGPTNPLGLVSAAVKGWKLGADGQWYAVAGIAYWDEAAPLKEAWAFNEVEGKKRPTGNFELDRSSNWFKMPRVMLSKVSEATMLRKGWPEDLSGLYVAEEMDRAMADMTASEALETYERDQRLIRTGSKDAIFVVWKPEDALEAVPMGQFADRAAAFVRACTSFPDLEGWKDQNRAALQDFWARAKSDALELKRIIETREKELAEANRA